MIFRPGIALLPAWGSPTSNARRVAFVSAYIITAAGRRRNGAMRLEKHEGGLVTSQIRLTTMAVALSAAGFATTGLAQQAQRPQIETTKVDGTDQVVSDAGRTIKFGGATLELKYFGLNHSDSNLAMSLPKEKIVFVVDAIPVGSFPGRGFIDIYALETEEFIKKVLALDGRV